jgi:hypothetical protein
MVLFMPALQHRGARRPFDALARSVRSVARVDRGRVQTDVRRDEGPMPAMPLRRSLLRKVR